MRKVGAHYYLRPDGTWGKRPVITLNEDGVIQAIKELGDHFKEEPGLEFFSGAIIPGFVEDWRSYDLKDAGMAQQLRKSLVSGTMNVFISEEQDAVLKPVFKSQMAIEVIQEDVNPIVSTQYFSAWEQIKNDWHRDPSNFNLATSIMKHTADIVSLLGASNQWGTIQIKAHPGLLLLQNIDWPKFTLKANTTVRILNR